MSEITIGYIKGDELPHSVRLDRDDGKPIYGRGTTLEGAIMRVISLSQMAQLTRYKAALEALAIEAEEHRAEYEGRAGINRDSYWQGRRDEAGHYRDKLRDALDSDAGKERE